MTLISFRLIWLRLAMPWLNSYSLVYFLMAEILFRLVWEASDYLPFSFFFKEQHQFQKVAIGLSKFAVLETGWHTNKNFR